jgi:hypothetical protein
MASASGGETAAGRVGQPQVELNKEKSHTVDLQRRESF